MTTTDTAVRKQVAEECGYDERPYESACCRQIHPDYLYRTAVNAGYHPPDYQTGRILDLGCGIGGNLLPYAIAFPQSRCTGTDISSRQIALAQDMAAALDLENAGFMKKAIIDMKAEDGPFDYILCHGVFSWVPEQVRQQIMALCRALLAPTGMAVISYNALPGGHFVSVLRDALRYHTKNIPGHDNIPEVRSFYRFLARHTYQDDTFRNAYKQFLHEESRTLDRLADNYIYHDQLAAENTPFYLSDFVDTARRTGLRYVGDAITDKLPLDQEATSFLETIEDPVQQEQYYDFLTFRRFHMSVLTLEENELSSVPFDTIKDSAAAPQVEAGEYPCSWPYARQQVLYNNETPMLTTSRRESIRTSLLLNLLTLYADGTRNRDDLVAALQPYIEKGDIRLRTPDGRSLTDTATLKAVIGKNLEVMAQAGLLTPVP